MVIEERIREWQQNFLSEYCKSCSDTCCNSGKLRILLDSYSLPIFQEKGIPTIKKKQLHIGASSKNKKWFLRDGSEVQKPSIVQVPKGMFQDEWYLYADFCPFYNSAGTCDIHEDPRRPRACVEYPINIFPESNDPTGKYLDIEVMKTCSHRGELISALAKDFPIRVIE